MEELSSSKQSRKNEQRRNKRKKDVEYSDKLRKQNCVAMAKKRAADAEFKESRNEASSAANAARKAASPEFKKAQNDDGSNNYCGLIAVVVAVVVALLILILLQSQILRKCSVNEESSFKVGVQKNSPDEGKGKNYQHQDSLPYY